ncbi:MAG: dehydrogenase [Candidatus Sumerlaeia bacterium]|nr:dehydrogenase [Candidatus Sumerlaeia bacterium]
MPKVYNWQIGREMEYPYEPGRPDKQFSAVFDTNKCIACQTCSIACKTTWTSGRGQEYMLWNNVESKPYGSFPLQWDLKVLDMIGGASWEGDRYVGKTIFEKAVENGQTVEGFLPTLEDWSYPNCGEDEMAGEPLVGGYHIDEVAHPVWFYYLPRICNHCSFPGCLANCPRQSIYKRPDNGIVLIDQERCHGYKQCVKGCPYKKAMFNSETGRSEKCIGCYPKAEAGLATQCIEQCIGKIRIQGWISPPEQAREDNPMDYLVHVRKVALPIYPQFGTLPNVYYIPPMTVPEPFLRQMFGPGVTRALRIYREELPNDPELQGLLLLFGSTNQIMTRFDVRDGWAHGYRRDGKEVARVPITEPLVVRPAYDPQYDVVRLDTT